jgi:hypothetical protein
MHDSSSNIIFILLVEISYPTTINLTMKLIIFSSLAWLLN